MKRITEEGLADLAFGILVVAIVLAPVWVPLLPMGLGFAI